MTTTQWRVEVQDAYGSPAIPAFGDAHRIVITRSVVGLTPGQVQALIYDAEQAADTLNEETR